MKKALFQKSSKLAMGWFEKENLLEGSTVTWFIWIMGYDCQVRAQTEFVRSETSSLIRATSFELTSTTG